MTMAIIDGDVLVYMAIWKSESLEEGKKKFSLVDEDKQERSTKTQAQIDEELIASFVEPPVVNKKSKKSKKKK